MEGMPEELRALLDGVTLPGDVHTPTVIEPAAPDTTHTTSGLLTRYLKVQALFTPVQTLLVRY
ncbi:hypothetical protein PHMEG_0009301 [Phytophthora megakarya]|uniref:Uncharacterized protein n=1 Tax=Phytophthora megakarya TaxID=4795 RepID=A0A225WGV3_9STRA|nr:hypothetical protein PHMEG_0009301 [Phytophthora megakarya]